MGHRDKGMRQEQELRLDVSMGMAMITLNDISRIVGEIAQRNPIRANQEDINKFLVKVNGIMVEKKLPAEEIRDNYLTALAIYTFAAPVMGMDVDMRVRDYFVNIARRNWDVADPFTVYFRSAQTDVESDVTADVSRGLVEVSRTATPRLFKSSGHVEADLGLLVKESREKLNPGNYSYGRHFRFVGAYGVCVPMFSAKIKEYEAAQAKDAELREKHGTFELQGPG